MLKNRIAPMLLLQGEKIVKTIKFSKPSYVGDPVNIVRIFNEKEIDEILLVDISDSKSFHEPNYSLISELASECFAPVTYGGGIRNINQARRIFSLGVEKISLQFSAFKDPNFISELAKSFGSQSIVLSVDMKRNWLNKPRLHFSDSSASVRRNWLEHVKQVIDLGFGEVLLNCVDRDGTMSGPDLELISCLSKEISVPLIAAGGVGSLQDIGDMFAAGASCAAVGSYFIYQGPHKAVLVSYPSRRDIDSISYRSSG